MPQEYPQAIISNAQRFGFKAANLMFLEKLLSSFELDNSEQKVIVPEIKAIDNEQIIAHLQKHIPEFEQKWQNFCTLQGNIKDFIEPEAITILESLQNEIKDCFKNNIFELESLPDSQKFMVRSSGEEDRVDVANPGGNESVSSLPEDISQNIGIVIASYISVKSLSQRLKLGEDITNNFPLSPCLIQSMVSESKEKNPVISGVIYTDDEHTRIQSAPGHGELIVNSKGNFDNYYITPTNKVYAEIRDKHFRIIPKMNNITKQMEQVEQNNDFKQATSPSLDEKAITYLHNLANFIEREYHMRMDIEFVYDSESKTVNIVQARPIPEGDRKGRRPSALANEFISLNNPKNLKAAVITPDIDYVSVINSPNEILICPTIEEALDIYLKGNKQIKAVIVKKDAPDTSHEAGMFSSKAIPVMQLDDIEVAKEWIKNLDRDILICDPQHKKLYQIPKAEYSEDLIKDGIYASTLTPFVTPLKQEFKDDENTQKFFEKLFKSLETQGEIRKYDGKLLREHLDNLAIPKFGKSALEQKDILASLLQFSARMRKKELISTNLFKEIILTGNELQDILSSMEQQDYNEKTSKYYLNIAEKFNGLMTSQRKKDILSSSVIGELNLAKNKEKYIELPEDFKHPTKSFFNMLEDFLGFYEEPSERVLTTRQKELFVEVVQFDKFIMKPENKIKWQEFCFQSCIANQGVVLANLCKDLMKLGLHEYFLNTSFLKEYSKNNALANLYREFDSGKEEREKLSAADRMISQMEHQITQWRNPEKYEELSAKLQENMVILKAMLHFDNKENLKEVLKDPLNGILIINHLNKLVDVFDLSIKALQNSNLYSTEQKPAQISRFNDLISGFNYFMQSIMADSPEEKIPERLSSLSKFISSKKNVRDINELYPSRDFNASAADIYQVRSKEAKTIIIGGDSFVRAFNYKDSKTLADAHTLIHQTALKSIAMHAEKINQTIAVNYPQIIQDMHKYYKKNKIFRNIKLDVGSFDITPSLIFSKLDGSIIHLHYNTSLRQHSGLVDIKYNYDSNKFYISYQLVGASENRWGLIAHVGKTLLESFTDAKEVQSRDTENSLFIEAYIDNLENIKTALDIFNMFSVSTFGSWGLSSLLANDGQLYNLLKQNFNQNFNLDSNLYNKSDIEFIKEFYAKAMITFADLNDQDKLERLKTLNRLDIKLTYLTNSPPRVMKNLLECSAEVFALITSKKAIVALKLYEVDPSYIASIKKVEQIEQIISDKSMNLFKHGIQINKILIRAIHEDQHGFTKEDNIKCSEFNLSANNSERLDKLIKISEDNNENKSSLIKLNTKILSRLFEEAILNNDIESISNIISQYDKLIKIYPKSSDLEKTYINARSLSEYGHADILYLLIIEGEKRNIPYYAASQFFNAARMMDSIPLNTLLKAVIIDDINTPITTDGQTILYFSILNGCVENVKLLLAAGADIEAVKYNGKTALSIANPEVTSILNEYIRNPVNYILNAQQNNPVELVKAIENIQKLHPLDSENAQKITNFLNKNFVNEECSNFRKIIDSRDKQILKTALSFNPQITAEEVRLINEHYPDIKISDNISAESKWVDKVVRVQDLGLVR